MGAKRSENCIGVIEMKLLKVRKRFASSCADYLVFRNILYAEETRNAKLSRTSSVRSATIATEAKLTSEKIVWYMVSHKISC